MVSERFLLALSHQSLILCSCRLAMLLQYGPCDPNGENPCFSTSDREQKTQQNYPAGAQWTERESKQVIAAEMMLRMVPHFPYMRIHHVIFVNVFKYMAFLCMQESRRGDCCHQEWAAWDVKIAGISSLRILIQMTQPSCWMPLLTPHQSQGMALLIEAPQKPGTSWRTLVFSQP